MGETHSTHDRDRQKVFLSAKLATKDYLGETSVDERVTLKRIFREIIFKCVDWIQVA
jgi:hypothetical protein